MAGTRFKQGPAEASKYNEESIEQGSQLIIHFYDPKVKAKDRRGRSLEAILSWSDSKLESCHNFIQLLFPLPEGSAFNLDAPLVDIAVMQAFRSRDELRQQLRRSFERMLTFYGFEVETKSETELESGKNAVLEKAQTGASTDTAKDADDSTAKKKTPSTEATSSPSLNGDVSASNAPPYNIICASNWRKQFQRWAVPLSHNHLRISRILRCLRVLGLEREAAAFFAALESVYEVPQLMISARSMGFWQSAATGPLHITPDGDKCGWLETWEKEQANLNKSAN